MSYKSLLRKMLNFLKILSIKYLIELWRFKMSVKFFATFYISFLSGGNIKVDQKIFTLFYFQIPYSPESKRGTLS